MSKRLTLIFLVLVMGFNLFWGLGEVPLTDPDETVYAETAREMIEFKDYLSPRIYNEFWYDKPPMYYWLVAGTFNTIGVGDSAARLPSAILGLATILMFYLSLSKLTNDDAAFWSSIVLGTSMEFFYLAKAAVTDMTLLFFMTAAVMAFLNKKYWLMYIFMGLATVTKGPIGLVFPGAIILLGLLFTGNLKEMKKVHFFRGLVLYFLVAAPWYYLMYTAHGAPFIDTFFGFHNVTRFTTPEHPGRVLWYYYIPVVIVGLFPWTGMLITSIRDSFRESSENDFNLMVFMNIWMIFVFLFFSVAKTKLVSYIFPMFPPMAAIIGWNIARIINARFPKKQIGMGILTIVLFLFLGGGLFYGTNFYPAVKFSGYLLSGILLVMAIAIGISFFQYVDIKLASTCMAISSVILMFTVFSFILPELSNEFTCKSASQFYTANCTDKVPVYVDKFLRPGFMHYTKNPGIELLPKTDALNKVIAASGAKYIVCRKTEFNRQERDTKKLKLIFEAGNSVIYESY